MTISELESSERVKAFMASLTANTVFASILEACQKKALPTNTKYRALTPVPGVHYDTTMAHDDQYRAGWSDCIEYLRNLSMGAAPIQHQADEEPYASAPEVQAIDAEIAKSKTANQT